MSERADDANELSPLPLTSGEEFALPHREDSSLSERRDVKLSVELTGPYNEVIGCLNMDDADPPPANSNAELFDPIFADFASVIEVIDELDGGIRSKIADESDVDASGWYVRNILEILRVHDVVSLDGNTWVLGPALEDESYSR